MKKNFFYLAIFLVFFFIFVIFYLGLNKQNNYIIKEIKNKKLSVFKSNELYSNKEFNSDEIIKNNKFTLINLWASWCVPCRAEHPILMNLSKNKKLFILGLNYKDKKNNSTEFINEYGNPYSIILTDPNGLVSISLGAFGVPETFFIGPEGKIFYKHIGIVSMELLENFFKPFL